MKKKALKKLSSVKSKHKPKHFFKRFKKTPSSHKDKNKGSLKFPNILRIITEKHFLVFFVSFALVVILVIVGLDLYKDILEQKKLETERKEIISKIQYWQVIVDKYKDYRDAYFQLALLEYRLKNFDKTKFYLDKSLSLDPNFEKGRELEKVLSSKY